MPNISGENEKWDDRSLGAHLEFAEIADDVTDEELNAATGLKPVSIRLDEDMVECLKFFAQMEGLGYQPLIRRTLDRWLVHEVKAYKKYREAELIEGSLPERYADCG